MPKIHRYRIRDDTNGYPKFKPFKSFQNHCELFRLKNLIVLVLLVGCFSSTFLAYCYLVDQKRKSTNNSSFIDTNEYTKYVRLLAIGIFFAHVLFGVFYSNLWYASMCGLTFYFTIVLRIHNDDNNENE